jgi:hypothetical protein
MPLLPARAAGDQHRTAASFDGGRAIRPVEVVEAQLDEVCPVGGVTLPTQLFDGLGRHRHAHERFAHG